MFNPSAFNSGSQPLGIMRTGSGQFASLVSLSFIDPNDLIQYETLFINCGPDSNGTVAGNTIKNLLVQTGLPAEILGSIWNLSAISSGGVSFCFAEFALTMFLVKLVQSGTSLPLALPAHIQQQMVASIANLQQNLRQRSQSISSNTVSIETRLSGSTIVIQPSHPHTSNAWAISPQEKAQYDATFKLWDPEGSGFISGDRASQVLMQSGLPDNILRHIWELSDIQKRGKLSPDEFAVAMHLVYSKLAGRDLPRTLPAELIPPSVRELEQLTAFAKNQALKQEPQRRISPSASLVGIYKPPSRSRSTSLSQSALVDNDDSAKREQLLETVEAKKKQLVQLKENSKSSSQKVTDIEVSLTKWKHDVVGLQNTIQSLQAQKTRLSSTVSISGGLRNGLTTAERARFEELKRDLPSLLDRIADLESKLHDSKLSQIKAKYIPKSGPSETGVQSKAAALLAARMAALGVTTNSLLPASMGSASSPSSPAVTMNDQIGKLEAEAFQRRQTLNEMRTRIHVYLEEINEALSIQDIHQNSSQESSSKFWNPPVTQVVRFEEGVGLKSTEASLLVSELKRISGQTNLASDFKSSTYIQENTAASASQAAQTSRIESSLSQPVIVSSPIHNEFANAETKRDFQPGTVSGRNTFDVVSKDLNTQNLLDKPNNTDSFNGPLSGVAALDINYNSQKNIHPEAAFMKPVLIPSRPASPPKPFKPASLSSKPSPEMPMKAIIPAIDSIRAPIQAQSSNQSLPVAQETIAVPPPFPSSRPTNSNTELSASSIPSPPLPVTSRQEDTLTNWPQSPGKVESIPTSLSIPPPPPPPPPITGVHSASNLPKPKTTAQPKPESHSNILSAALASHRGRMGIVSDTDDSQSEGGWESASARSASPVRSPIRPIQQETLSLSISSQTSTPRPLSPQIQNDSSSLSTTAVAGAMPPPPPPPPPTDEYGIVKPVSRGPSVVSRNDNGTADSTSKKPNPKDIGGVGLNIFALAAQEAKSKKSVVPEKDLSSPVQRSSLGIAETGAKETPEKDNFINPLKLNGSNHSDNLPTSLIIENTDKPSQPPSSTQVVAEDPFEAIGTPTIVSKTDSADISEDSIGRAVNYAARLIFDYPGGSPDDLQAKSGDIVTVTKESGEWIFAQNQAGMTGWLPKNYTAVISAATEKLSKRLAEALYDFNAQNVDELSVTSGERVQVVEGSENEPWWRIENGNGKQGLVPASYLRIVEVDITSPSEVTSPTDSRSDTQPLEMNPIHNSISLENPFGNDVNENPFGYDDSPLYGQVAGYIDTSNHTFSTAGMSVSTSVDFREFSALRSSSTKNGIHRSGSLTNIENASSEEKKRFEAIQEVIFTERSYIEDLRVITNVFMAPILENGWDLSAVFYNVQDVYDASIKILEDFELVVSPSAGEHASLGAVILENLDRLECYRLYCTNLSNATSILNKARMKDEKLQNFLLSLRQQGKAKNLDLSSYLLVPMQRITRYPLLFRQILHYTPKDHPEHEATLLALQMCDEFLEKVNSEIKALETEVKMKEIQRSVDLELPEEGYKLDLFSPTRYMGKRLILKEGLLMKHKSGRQLRAYLFNDIILFVTLASNNSKGKAMALYRKPLTLHGMSIHDVEASCFQIVCGSDMWTLRASSPREKREWMNAISTAIANHKREEKQATSKAKNAASQAPMKRETIGTLRLSLLEAKDLAGSKRLPIYAVIQIQDQLIRSRKAEPQAKYRWNQSILFSVFNLDDFVRISLYSYDKYSKDEYLGSAEMQLDFLEYYGEKETEIITLNLRDVSSGRLSIQMMYRRT